jgi:hypothetical protein
MQGNRRFIVWAQRSAKSVFGAASNPVKRNGRFLLYHDEKSARLECDRLNAGAGGSHVHYSVRLAVLRTAPPPGTTPSIGPETIAPHGQPQTLSAR